MILMFKKYILKYILIFFIIPGFTKEKLTLDEAISIALKYNLQIIAAKEKLNEVKGSIREAKASRYFTLEGASTFTRLNEAPSATIPAATPPLSVYTTNPMEQNILAGMGAQKFTDYIGLQHGLFANNYIIPPQLIEHELAFSDVNIYNTKLTLTQPIYTFGRIKNAIRIAKLSYKAANYEYEKTKQDIILKVKDAYFGVLRAKHFVEVAESATNSAKEHLDIVKKLYSQGVVAKYDLLRAEVAVADIEQRLITAKNGLELAKTALATILGEQFKPEDIEVEEVEPSTINWQPSTIKVEDLIDKAYKKRVEIMQLQESIKIAQCAVELAKATNKPTIALVSNFEYKKGDRLPSQWSDYWNVTLAVSYPFLDIGKTYGKIQQAKSKLAQTRNGLQQLKQGIALEVKQAYLDLIASKEKIVAAEKSIEQAEEGLRLAEERYKYGVSTEVEVTDARCALIQSRTNYYNAIYEYQIAYAKLKRATGEE